MPRQGGSQPSYPAGRRGAEGQLAAPIAFMQCVHYNRTAQWKDLLPNALPASRCGCSSGTRGPRARASSTAQICLERSYLRKYTTSSSKYVILSSHNSWWHCQLAGMSASSLCIQTRLQFGCLEKYVIATIVVKVMRGCLVVRAAFRWAHAGRQHEINLQNGRAEFSCCSHNVKHKI